MKRRGRFSSLLKTLHLDKQQQQQQQDASSPPTTHNHRRTTKSTTKSISRTKSGFNIFKSFGNNTGSSSSSSEHIIPLGNEQDDPTRNDNYNYALLIALYTLQGIPMGLSASIPFLIQQKIKYMASAAASAAAATTTTTGATAATAAAGVAAAASTSASSAAAAASYNANAIFALCSWPFSLKLLWAPIVDAVFFKQFGRRKTWLVPVQAMAGLLMVGGANFVEQQLGLESGSLVSSSSSSSTTTNTPPNNNMNVKGVTLFFIVLYFLMATQDIAVDGWALTMLSKKNRGRGPVCNSIGQNLGYFISFVGFLALNDIESSETLWRPLLGLPSNPHHGLVSLGGFIKSMGIFMLAVTTFVAIFKREVKPLPPSKSSTSSRSVKTNHHKHHSKEEIDDNDDDDGELDASEIGLKETYHRLWAVCQLPAVRWLFVILLTYRLPTALSDNVKFLKGVEFGLSKSTTALLSPTVILPLGIAVPIMAAKIWHGHPLRQFMTAYKIRVTLVPLLDVLMLLVIRHHNSVGGASSSSWSIMNSRGFFWFAIVSSTALQTIVNSLQFNAQMTFFASRVDPAIGGSYMTLLNTAGNLGGTWPSSLTMLLVGKLTTPPTCTPSTTIDGGGDVCTGGRDAYFPLQLVYSVLGIAWILLCGQKVRRIAELPDDAWRTHLLDDSDESTHHTNLSDYDDIEAATNAKDSVSRRKKEEKHE